MREHNQLTSDCFTKTGGSNKQAASTIKSKHLLLTVVVKGQSGCLLVNSHHWCSMPQQRLGLNDLMYDDDSNDLSHRTTVRVTGITPLSQENVLKFSSITYCVLVIHYCTTGKNKTTNQCFCNCLNVFSRKIIIKKSYMDHQLKL